jgi:hypothetical protein
MRSAGIASGISGIVSATRKPDTPKQPPAVRNRQALMADRARAAAAQGRSSTIIKCAILRPLRVVLKLMILSGGNTNGDKDSA